METQHKIYKNKPWSGRISDILHETAIQRFD